MALLSDLVSICVQHRLDSEATLTLFARELREAGRVSKAGRGRGAAKMTFLDGARFLIACAATDHPKRAADAEAEFSKAVFERGSERSGRNSSSAIGKDDAEPTLDLALASILRSIADGTLEAAEQELAAANGHAPHPVISVLSLDVFRSGVSANLAAGPVSMHYIHPAQAQMHKAAHSDTLLALSEAWVRETERFRSGKNLHARLDGALLRDIATAIGEDALV